MKTLLPQPLPIAFLALFLWSCESAPPPYQVYTYAIDRDNPNLDGSSFISETEEDTIMARNDTLAYERALINFYATKHTLGRFNGRMGAVHEFEIRDSLGANLGFKLDSLVIDSLIKRVESVQL